MLANSHLDKSLLHGGHQLGGDDFSMLSHAYSQEAALMLSEDPSQSYAAAGSYIADLGSPANEASQWDMQALLNLDGEELLVDDLDNAAGLHHMLQDSLTTTSTARGDPKSSKATLRCPHPSCSSKTVFTRQCDVDKHYRLHFRQYFCRIEGCPQNQTVAFATVKDRDRHERAHNPSIPCEHCGKLFSRQDNLRDHCRRRHAKGK